MKPLIMGVKKLGAAISKTILVLVVFFAVIALFSAWTSKDKIKIDPEATTKRQRAEIYQMINDPQYQKDDAGKAAIGVYRAMLCGTIGEACTDNPADADKNFDHSLFGFVSNLIVMPYANPPASGVQYIAYSLGNAGLLPKAYAAEGIGFASIKPMIEIWKAFRNVAYLILVLVLIAIGFMIMFRMKLNPQTVISLENSLPKIVISLILITFSFAIAGLLIDLMYVVISFGISILSEIKTTKLGNMNDLQNQYILSGMDKLWPPWQTHDVGFAMTKLIPGWIRGPLDPIITGLGTWWAFVAYKKHKLALTSIKSIQGIGALSFNAGNISALIALIIEGIIAWKFSAIFFGTLLTVLLLFTFIFFIFRIFFMLLVAYLKSLLLIMFAPIFLLFDAIPGKNVFSFWLKNLVGELLTFPVVIILILIGRALSSITLSKTEIFRPPFLYAIDQTAFASILGLGIILIMPNVVKATKELLGIKGLPGLGLGPGTFFAGAGTLVGGGLGLVSQFGSLSLAMPWLRRGVGGLPLIGPLFQTDEMKKTAAEAAAFARSAKTQVEEHGKE